jgi:hypothetical protein
LLCPTDLRIAAPKFFRQQEKQLGVFQRRAQKGSSKGGGAAKIANRHRHFLHVMSHGLVRHSAEFYVAEVSEAGEDTGTAKSVHDAGWSMLGWKTLIY